MVVGDPSGAEEDWKYISREERNVENLGVFLKCPRQTRPESICLHVSQVYERTSDLRTIKTPKGLGKAVYFTGQCSRVRDIKNPETHCNQKHRTVSKDQYRLCRWTRNKSRVANRDARNLRGFLLCPFG